jgi:hypothetical protein
VTTGRGVIEVLEVTRNGEPVQEAPAWRGSLGV